MACRGAPQGAGFLLQPAHERLEFEWLLEQACDGDPFKRLSALPDTERVRLRVDLAHDGLPGQLLRHVIGATVDLHVPSGLDRAGLPSTVEGVPPAVRVDGRRERRALGKHWEGHGWRAMAARARLIGPLVVVVLPERRGHLPYRFERLRQVDLQAFPVPGALKALDKGIASGSARRTDEDLDAQYLPKAHEGGGEIAPARAADETRIAR